MYGALTPARQRKGLRWSRGKQQDRLQIDIATQAVLHTCWRTSTGIHSKQEEPSHNDHFDVKDHNRWPSGYPSC